MGKRYNVTSMIVDRLTKIVYFVLTLKKTLAKELVSVVTTTRPMSNESTNGKSHSRDI